MHKLFFLIVIISLSVRAQITDSIRITLPADTLITDTLSLSDSLALADTVGLLSDSLNLTRIDTIKPIYQQALYRQNYFINKREFYRRAYFFSGDIFQQYPFAFNPTHGFTGQPDNLLFYGTGSSLTSYLVNGINYNDYFYLPPDLNRISTEYIDSAEVIPLPRGFVYGINNNVSAVNFIGKDFISIVPYSRIRYYEGPYEEGFFDGIFNSIIFRNFNLFFQLTNRKADNRYQNTDFSKWNGRVQLKYLLNNTFNFLGGYEYSNTNGGVSGGIDVFNLPESSLGFWDNIYNEISTPVVYNDLRFNTYTNHLYLKTFARTGSFSNTDLSVYYRFNRIELNGNVNDTLYSDNLFKNKISGAAFNQDFRYSIFDLKLLGNLEYADIAEYSVSRDVQVSGSIKATNLSVAGIFSASFDSILYPSVFYKINNEKYLFSKNYYGFGADATLKFYRGISIYGGYSEFENKYINGRSKNVQAGLRYSQNEFNAGTSYFSREASSNINPSDTIVMMNSVHYYPGKIEGVNFNFDILISKIKLEGKVDYYRSSNDLTTILPSSVVSGGVYYIDSLFTGSLDLKTGFNVFYYGRRNLNLGPEYFNYYQEGTIGPNVRLDFFASGEIQGTAIIFFSWENLLDEKYFFVPFYPLPPRSIRFGVSWEIFN